MFDIRFTLRLSTHREAIDTLFSYNRLNLIFIQIKSKKPISNYELWDIFREKQIIFIKITNFA